MWTKNPNWSDDVTHVRKIFRVYYFETTGVPLYLRHKNVSRDLIIGELLRNKEKFSRKPGNLPRRHLWTKNPHQIFILSFKFFEEKLVWEVSQRHLWTKNPDNFLRMTNRSVRYCDLLNIIQIILYYRINQSAVDHSMTNQLNALE